MQHREGYLKGSRNTEIFYQYWLPESPPEAIMLIVHGLAEHSGRYMNVVKHLEPLGYAIYGIDHIGHGKSAGKRAHVERFQDFTGTLEIYVELIQNWQPQKPIFLIGHSMGGLIGTTYLLEHQDKFSGAVLSGPSIKVPDIISQATIVTGKLLSILMPKMGIVQLDSGGISRDPAVVAAYNNDPLVFLGKTTARIGAEILKAMQQISDQAASLTLPLLILQGSADKLVDPSGAQMLYDMVGSKDKTIKIYDGLYHEVFNEPENARVLNDVSSWLKAHLDVG